LFLIIFKLFVNMTSQKKPHSNKNPILNSHQQPKDKIAPSQNISYSVAHAIPGRVRFRIPRLVKDSEYANKLKRVIESDSRITDVRLNLTAASIVINYQPGVSDQQMRSHLVNLIQNAPNIVLPPQVTAKSVLGAIFDAVINLIDSTRNINKARNAIMYGQPRRDIWERLLFTTETMIKRLRSAMMFILPNKRWRARNEPKEIGLQLERLQEADAV
jgi:hypothetical protein